ncbi:FG-GAP and VCBS repeat-containing protein [Streptomyces litchfieldiae]|uniref:FG-GAP and VCBS repeat-containing protein n=1 Tax=Streptomyces litchfieldiae TaxID=3075543 RepID=A0ABU2MLM2_9ACTN|nr:FG-GAP and VCBS repeat-containing protein [Streptomyces sp. DSM 44938]MDT0341544.1 FG-GAP and VCBS repeat-containing protein [Streptomyces sp. DSM 44938]
MRLPRTRAVVVGVTAVAAVGLAPAPAAARPAVDPAVPPAAGSDDINGDGHRDYVQYADWLPGVGYAGGVRITYGTASGPGTVTQDVHQETPGIPGQHLGGDDMFGSRLAVGDFNGDGYGDIVAGSLGAETAPTLTGTLVILWGSASGVSGGTALPHGELPPGGPHYGEELATGDFDGDGHPDIAAATGDGVRILHGPFTPAGGTGPVTRESRADFFTHSLVAGDLTGDGTAELVVIGAQFGGNPGATDAWLPGGATLRLDPSTAATGEAVGVVADFDQDGYGDVAFGVPTDDNFTGALVVWPGGPSGPGTPARLTQPGTPDYEERFGHSVSAGDVNGDGFPELAVGSPGEWVDNQMYAGGVTVLSGGPGGLTAAGAQWLDRETPGVPEDAQFFGEFGRDVRLRDSDGDGHADLFAEGGQPALLLPGGLSGIDPAAGATQLPGSGFVAFPQ